jgi:hypothetical protein
MSQVKGTISVDLAFTDSTTVSGAQSLKTITMRDATEYTTGKVAVVTGTVGTAAVSLYAVDGSGLANLYKNANGDAIGAISPALIALKASNTVIVEDTDLGLFKMVSSNNLIASCSALGSSAGQIFANAGTASYTVILYAT